MILVIYVLILIVWVIKVKFWYYVGRYLRVNWLFNEDVCW